MKTFHSNSGAFCDFHTDHAGWCGMWVKEGNRCKRHVGKTEKPRRQAIGKYSGYSKYRQEHGEFQRR